MIRLIAILIGGVLGGCAAPSVPPAGSQLDGSYTGQNTLTRGWGYLCGAISYPASLTVSGGRFDYPFAVSVSPPRTVPVPIQIAADGTFAGQLQYVTKDYFPMPYDRTTWVTVTGRIAAGALDATITDYRCTRRLMAKLG